MDWVFLSPHFDDAAFSCGGLIWERASAGDAVQIWTVCGGDVPPGELSAFAESLHNRWQTGREAVSQRRLEDDVSCNRLMANPVRFGIPDCIYRRAGDYWKIYSGKKSYQRPRFDHLYTSRDDIFGPIPQEEDGLVDYIFREFASRLPEKVQLVCPLAIGGHVDHRLVRAAAQILKRPLLYYADLPYVIADWDSLETIIDNSWTKTRYPISSAGLESWVEGAAAHASQISTFWPDQQSLRQSFEAVLERLGGIVLWNSNG